MPQNSNTWPIEGKQQLKILKLGAMFMSLYFGVVTCASWLIASCCIVYLVGSGQLDQSLKDPLGIQKSSLLTCGCRGGISSCVR